MDEQGEEQVQKCFRLEGPGHVQAVVEDGV